MPEILPTNILTLGGSLQKYRSILFQTRLDLAAVYYTILPDVFIELINVTIFPFSTTYMYLLCLLQQMQLTEKRVA